MIMPYNRVVKDLNGLTKEEFLMQFPNILTLNPVEKSILSGTQR